MLCSSAMAQDDTPPEEPRVTGSILFKDIPNLSDPSGSSANWRIPAPHLAREARLPLEQMLVVVSTSDDAPGDPERLELSVSGYAISPVLVALQPGSSLRFTNNGPAGHTLKSVGRATIKNIELAEPGKEPVELTLEKPGRYVFQDLQHPSVLVYVVVMNKVATSKLTQVSSTKATFDLGSLPPGSYQLTTYMRGKPVDEREISVSSAGAAPIEFLLTGEDLLEAQE